MDSILKRRATRVVATIAALSLAAAAYAYWTGGGGGAGAATTAGGASALTVNQTTVVPALYPGRTVALSGTFDNPNTFDVAVSSVTASLSTTDPDCNVGTNYAVTGTSTIGNGGLVVPGNGVGSWSGLTLEMLNLPSNQDTCKGAPITITYSAS